MTAVGIGRRLALGTAQFGLDYGITNVQGRMPEAEAARVLSAAAAGGIDTLDTAAAYGDAEIVLGTLGAAQRFRLVTKISGPAETLVDAARESARRLGRMPDTVLLHAPAALAGADGSAVASALLALRDAGLAGTVGVSVYTPAELEAALRRLRPGLVQLPFNLFDRRFAPAIARLADAGIEVHARSLFLQGTLLAPAPPPRLRFAAARFAALHAVLGTHRLTALEACLAAGLSMAGIARLVVGVSNVADLTAILAARPPDALPAAFAELACNEPDLVDPSRWPRG